MTTKLIGTAELAKRVAEYTETPRGRVLAILDAIAEVAAEALIEGKRVRIPGIGILWAKPTPARDGIGPDGQPYHVQAGFKVKLKPSLRVPGPPITPQNTRISTDAD